MFTSMLSRVYAGYSESKVWLVVFTRGSLAVLILYWSWTAYVFKIPYFRYLDIGLGLVLFSSMLSLVYAGYSESKAWLVVFTSGSLAVLILYWSWAAYNKYVSTDYSEYSQEVSYFSSYFRHS